MKASRRCVHDTHHGSMSIEHSRVQTVGKPPEQSAAPVLLSQQMRAISSKWSRSSIGQSWACASRVAATEAHVQTRQT
jgi:hypothetical protein